MRSGHKNEELKFHVIKKESARSYFIDQLTKKCNGS